jgi:hypothetical protein
MKKVLLFLPLTGLLLSSTCKKSTYICMCSISGTNGGYAVTNQSEGQISQTDANNLCSSWENEQQSYVGAAGGTGTVNCSLSEH